MFYLQSFVVLTGSPCEDWAAGSNQSDERYGGECETKNKEVVIKVQGKTNSQIMRRWIVCERRSRGINYAC